MLTHRCGLQQPFVSQTDVHFFASAAQRDAHAASQVEPIGVPVYEREDVIVHMVSGLEHPVTGTNLLTLGSAFILKKTPISDTNSAADYRFFCAWERRGSRVFLVG